ncbi:MAG: ribonuclease P protein component, partial [bacterium]
KPTKAAFIVSEKTASNAVDRNRIKRLMKEAFRLRSDDLKSGYNLVFLATRQADAKQKRQQFDHQINRHFSSAQLTTHRRTSTSS